MITNRIKFFDYITQHPFNYLCWAACVAMITRWLYRKDEIDLEYVVNLYLNNGNSKIGSLDELDQTIEREDLPQVFIVNKITGSLYKGYLVSTNVKYAIDNNSPILACLEGIQYFNSEHVLLIVGYTSDSYVVHDPYANGGYGLVRKDRLERGYAQSFWVESWIDFKRKDG